jgi:hypothetical protein
MGLASRIQMNARGLKNGKGSLAAGELVRVYDFSAARKVADVGGAHGVLLSRQRFKNSVV